MARRLKGEGVTTLGELVAFCNRRGASWWRSIPRIGGPGRARAIVSWLRRQQAPLGLIVDVDSAEKDGAPLIAAELVEVVPAHDHEPERQGQGGAARRAAPDQKVTRSDPHGLSSSHDEQTSRMAGRLILAPLERLAVPQALSSAN